MAGTSGSAGGVGGNTGVAGGGGRGGGEAGRGGASGNAGGAFGTGGAGGSGQAGRGGATAGTGGVSGGGGSGQAGRGGATAGTGGAGGGGGSGEAGRGGASAGAGGTTAACNAPAPTNFAGTPEPCASTAACAPDALGRSFSAPVRIDDGTDCTIRSVRALLPNASNPGLLVWNAASPERVRARRVTAGGAWSAIEAAGDAWGASFDVAMTTASDALIVGARADRVLSTASLGGAAWTALADLGGPHDVAGSIAVTTQRSGPGLAVWTRSPSPGGYATWTPASGWTPSVAFTNTFDRAAITTLPGDGFAMARLSGGFIDLFIYAAGSGWGSSESVGGFDAATDGARSAINVAADAAGNIHVVWTRPGSNGQPSYAYYREYLTDGSWAPFVVSLDTDVDTRVQPQIAASRDGDVIIAVASANSTRPRWSVRLREGATWQEARPLNFQTTPAVAMDDTGNALVAWARDDSQFGLVQASRYQAGVGWETGNLVTIHAGGPGATCPSVAAQLSPTGQALVGYVMRRPGEPDRVYAHTLR